MKLRFFSRQPLWVKFYHFLLLALVISLILVGDWRGLAFVATGYILGIALRGKV